jgi:hypothetical protein
MALTFIRSGLNTIKYSAEASVLLGSLGGIGELLDTYKEMTKDGSFQIRKKSHLKVLI